MKPGIVSIIETAKIVDLKHLHVKVIEKCVRYDSVLMNSNNVYNVV